MGDTAIEAETTRRPRFGQYSRRRPLQWRFARVHDAGTCRDARLASRETCSVCEGKAGTTERSRTEARSTHLHAAALTFDVPSHSFHRSALRAFPDPPCGVRGRAMVRDELLRAPAHLARLLPMRKHVPQHLRDTPESAAHARKKKGLKRKETRENKGKDYPDMRVCVRACVNKCACACGAFGRLQAVAHATRCVLSAQKLPRVADPRRSGSD